MQLLQQRDVVAVAGHARRDETAERPPEQEKSPKMSRILWRANSSGKRSGVFTTPFSPIRMQLLQAAAAREAHLLERLDLAEEPERARRRDLGLEALGVGERKTYS